MEANLEDGVEKDATGGEGGVGYKHPDFPPDPLTDRSRHKWRGVWNALESLVRELPDAVRKFESSRERLDLEKAREIRSLMQQDMSELLRLRCKEDPEEVKESDELLKRAELELRQIGARLDIGGGGGSELRV